MALVNGEEAFLLDREQFADAPFPELLDCLLRKLFKILEISRPLYIFVNAFSILRWLAWANRLITIGILKLVSRTTFVPGLTCSLLKSAPLVV